MGYCGATKIHFLISDCRSSNNNFWGSQIETKHLPKSLGTREYVDHTAITEYRHDSEHGQYKTKNRMPQWIDRCKLIPMRINQMHHVWCDSIDHCHVAENAYRTADLARP